ncbi:ACT domain-containing protein [Candidatus Aerophobetes bacterium]|nr:ACT domain-containing protein [Candidatus Aerophobetes bacterium]
MDIKQVSVFLENKIGRLAEAVSALGKEGINIRALSIADTAEFGILRMIVNQPQKAGKILEGKGFTVSQTNVLAIEVPDKPGGLAKVLAVLKKKGINVEYLYAFVAPIGDNALVVLKTEKLEEAKKILKVENIKILTSV